MSDLDSEHLQRAARAVCRATDQGVTSCDECKTFWEDCTHWIEFVKPARIAIETFHSAGAEGEKGGG